MNKSDQSKLVQTLKQVNGEFFEEFKDYLRHVYPFWQDKVENPDEVRWFCCQSEQEQIGYLLDFIGRARNNSLFGTIKQIIIGEFLKEKEEQISIQQALMKIVSFSDKQMPTGDFGKMSVEV